MKKSKGRKSNTSKSDGLLEVEKDKAPSIDDPVRIYLRQMGKFSILSRKGEVEIAKRIEEGEKEVIKNVSRCPITTIELLEMEPLIKKEMIPIQPFVTWNDLNNLNGIKREKEYKRVTSILKRIRRLNNKLTKVLSILVKTKKGKTKEKLETDRNKIRAEIAGKIIEINLSNKQIDKLIEAIKKSADYIHEDQQVIDSFTLKSKRKLTKKKFLELEKIVRSARRKIGKFEQTFGVTQEELNKTVRAIYNGPQNLDW